MPLLTPDKVRRQTFFLAVASVLLTACGDRTGGSAEASTARSTDPSLDASTVRFKQVEDSVSRLLAGLDAGAEEMRKSIEVREKAIETLSTTAPDALAKLTLFVDEYRTLKLTLAAKDDTIKQLRDRVQALLGENRKLRTEVAQLKGRLGERDALIARSDSLAKETETKLEAAEGARDSVITRLRRGFVLVAAKKELERLGLVGKTNRFGLGAAVLKQIDPALMQQLDIAQTSEISVPAAASKVRVLTTHPQGSWIVAPDGAGSKVRIRDADAFWATTKVVVVMFED